MRWLGIRPQSPLDIGKADLEDELMIVAKDGEKVLVHLQNLGIHPGTSGRMESNWRIEQTVEAYRQLTSGQRRLLRFLTEGGTPEIAESATQQIDAAERQLDALGVDEIYLGVRTKGRRDLGRGSPLS